MGEGLGRELVEAGLVSEDQLAEAVRQQSEFGGQGLTHVLVKLRLVDEEKLLAHIAKREGLQVVKSEGVVVDREIMPKLPRDLVERHELVPLSHTATHLRLALPDPADLPAIEEVRFLTGLEVEVLLVSSRDALRAIGEFYSEGETPGARRRQKRDMRQLAREVSGMPEPLDANRAVAGIDTSPAKLIRALAALLIEKRAISADELRDRVRRLEQ